MLQPIKGHATSEGTFKYKLRNADFVDDFNFNRVLLQSQHGKKRCQNMALSKIIYSTANGASEPFTDLLQYNALKYAVLSGGVNHIDTGQQYRR